MGFFNGTTSSTGPGGGGTVYRIGGDRIISVERIGLTAKITATGTAGANYLLQGTTNIASPAWVDLAAAGGTESSVMDYGLTSFGDDAFAGLPPLGGAGFPGAGSLDPFDAATIEASAASAPSGPIAQEFAATAGASPASTSMADTLRSAFGIGGGASTAPDHVQAAYGQLARFGF